MNAGSAVPAFLEARRSIRSFVDEPVPRDALDRFVQAACTAPAPHHSRPWRWVVVDTAEGKQALADSHAVTATFNGEFISTARPGDRVEGSGEVIKAGRSMVFLRGVVMNATTAEPMMSFSAVLKKVNLRT